VPDGDAPPAPSASHTDAGGVTVGLSASEFADHCHWATHDQAGVDPIKVGACRGHVAGRRLNCGSESTNPTDPAAITCHHRSPRHRRLAHSPRPGHRAILTGVRSPRMVGKAKTWTTVDRDDEQIRIIMQALFDQGASAA